MKTIKGQTFTREDVTLDDMEFIDCKFIKCRISYAGGPFNMQGCDFEQECTFVFSGPAKYTGKLLRTLGWTPPPTRPKIM